MRFVKTVVRAIYPAAKRIVTDDRTLEADILVVALGTDLDLSATPGLVEGGNDSVRFSRHLALRDILRPGLRGARP